MAGRQEAYLRLLPPAVFAGVCRFLRFYGEKSSVSICLCVHLLLNLWKIGSGLAKSKLKTVFSFCLCARLSLSLNKIGCGSV